ncbi:MAG: hypothetical protein ACO1SV_11720 [Fimbriimonas sp.]
MSTILSRTQVRRFRFSGADGLFRDPQGRRVVADVEGIGEWRLEVAEPPLLVVRDEEWTEPFLGRFAKSLSVLALGPGEVQIAVAIGPLAARTGTPTTVVGPFAGAGWVLNAEGPLLVDGRREAAPLPSADLPIPFLFGAEAREMRILPALFRAERVDGWRIDDGVGLRARGWQVQNLSRPVELSSRFPNGDAHSGVVASHLNAASWRCELPADNLGLRLRKTYDRFHGRQRARVFVDGFLAGWWYEPEEDRRSRWHVSDFDLDPALTVGKAEVTITIDPPSGSPLWSVGEMETFAIRPFGGV